MQQPKITVIGSINCDISFSVQGFPAPNETIMAKSSSLSTGGKGLNQAIAAAHAGAKTTMIGCIGNDGFGEKATRYAKKNGLDLSGLKTVTHTSTGTAGIIVTEASENMIVVSSGANAYLTPNDIMRNAGLIERAAIIVVQLEIPADTVRTALSIANNARVRTLLNPAPATPEAIDLIASADIISPNESETQTLTGIYPHDADSARRAATRLCERGAREVVITMGESGYYIFTQGNGRLYPAFGVTAIDPTGAGDVFNGVLACMLAGSRSITEASHIASAAGALSVMQAGAEGAAPDWSQIQNFLIQNTPG